MILLTFHSLIPERGCSGTTAPRRGGHRQFSAAVRTHLPASRPQTPTADAAALRRLHQELQVGAPAGCPDQHLHGGAVRAQGACTEFTK